MSHTEVTLEDKYELASGRVFLSGTQALVRLPLLRRQLDEAAGLNTAGYISGYRGSPLGGYDGQLAKAQKHLEDHHIEFQPGVNEDLAATAIWGTQQAPSLPGCRYDGIFSIWYGKGPGVDRSGDVFKHGNRLGSAQHGGVLLAFGDDHPGKSSTVAHQSEQAIAANGIPVLYPATVQDYLDLGIHGFALSRFSGLWVGFKCVNETVECTATVEVGLQRHTVELPRVDLPNEGLNAKIAFDPAADDVRLARFKIPAAYAYCRANGLDKTTVANPQAQLGIVAAGKSWLDVNSALQLLQIDDQRAQELGIRVYKVAMISPLEPTGIRAFAQGLQELLFVEEKQAFMEPQAAHLLYNLPDSKRPRIVGKADENGEILLPSDVQLEPLRLARLIGARLLRCGASSPPLKARLDWIDSVLYEADQRLPSSLPRTPYFCSGCPHNTSTKVPEGSLAMSGIGCHTMAAMMNRNTLPPTQMGGEGLNWTGIAPFSELDHVFQNLGDGTYFHSGLLAVRASVVAGVNVTYKVLYNDAVAMTGGQQVEGNLTVAEIAQQLRAERVGRIAVVNDGTQPTDYASGLPDSVEIYHRDKLDQLQREFRELPGVTAIIYDQTCAAEKRRRRKRGSYPDPKKRLFINHWVCEGCGDCSVKANCVSILPRETEFGRKREIDQSSCNKDYSCQKGFCPSFITILGGDVRKPTVADLDLTDDGLPAPAVAGVSQDILITGIGGTGVVTVGAVLGMAAHLESKSASVFDMTGLAQKGGAVLSHLRIGSAGAELHTPKIGANSAGLILGCDLVVAAGQEVLRAAKPGTTRAVLNRHLVPTAAFQSQPNLVLSADQQVDVIKAVVGADHTMSLDAQALAAALLGNTIGANMILVGFALQRGLLPVGLDAIERAIELNAVAVDFNKKALLIGRMAAADPARLSRYSSHGVGEPAPENPPSLESIIELRRAFLTDYQNAMLAERYDELVSKVAKREGEVDSSSNDLMEAVARYYFKLLAYKDEYEVARLHSDGRLEKMLEQSFEGDFKIQFSLAPPLLARPDKVTGEPEKRSFGPWVLKVFRLLARMKFLRGTVLDPFGYTAERKMERQLIADYEKQIAEMLPLLTTDNLATAVELASLPEQIRGYGPVKERSIKATARRQEALLSAFHAEPAKQAA